MSTNFPRLLYWDIDGVIRDYNDIVKPALAGGKLQDALARKSNPFDYLVCVSGWSSIVLDNFFLRNVDLAARKERLRQEVADAFPCPDFFARYVRLADRNDDRCRHIAFDADWAYVDDWAEEYFIREHGREAYDEHLGRRILMCDPYDDGQDLLDFVTNF